MIKDRRNHSVRLCAAAFLAAALCFGASACSSGAGSQHVTENEQHQQVTDSDQKPNGTREETMSETNHGKTVVYAHIGKQTLDIALEDNSSARAFMNLVKRKDVTLTLDDYGGFEKVGDLGTSLPTNDTHITTSPGDLILYQGNEITIYYGRNTWDFTRLGHARNIGAQDLRTVLHAGGGPIRVTFSVRR
jgi:hypothetical protein